MSCHAQKWCMWQPVPVPRKAACQEHKPSGKRSRLSLVRAAVAASTQVQELSSTVLPNGIPIKFVSKADVNFLYSEVWEGRHYLRNKVAIGPGDVVIDVGANIGLFAMLAAEMCPGGHVLAFEPLPATFEALTSNVAAQKAHAKPRGRALAEVRCFNAGVADGEKATAIFTYYRRAAGWSTMVPDDKEINANMEVFLHSALSSKTSYGQPLLALLGRALRLLLPAPLFAAAAASYVRRLLHGGSAVESRLTSISDVMREEGIEAVDLLKIDVERAEMLVLRGVSASAWLRIRQVAMEVHDGEWGSGSGGRLAAVVRTLREAGFESIVVDQSPDLAGTTLFNVYATRGSGPPAPAVGSGSSARVGSCHT